MWLPVIAMKKSDQKDPDPVSPADESDALFFE
jgi:hypothetical protein